MSSRTEQRTAAREARLEAERHETVHASRVRRIRVLIGLGLLALLVVVVAIAAGSGGGSGEQPAKKPSETASLFAGIPQNGLTLGKASARATLEEFVDPQCPYCKEFSLQGLPSVVKDYVRTGKVKLVIRPLTFIGPESVTAARTVVAAGLQDKAFPYLEQFYANQGQENSGYVTDGFLRRVGGQVEGLDLAKAMSAATSDASITQQIAAAKKRAQQMRVDSTPTLLLTTGGKTQQIRVDASDYAGSVTSGLSAALGT